MIKNMNVTNTLHQIKYSNQSLQNSQISYFLSRAFLQYKVCKLYKLRSWNSQEKKEQLTMLETLLSYAKFDYFVSIYN